MPSTDVVLSLVSHTNVGKTTLARTLLGADVGEVRDAPHVTDFADGHDLVATPAGERLRLWDTPGFGDSARLLRRLRASGQPLNVLGWLLSQVWDRWTDRPFWMTQQALRHVQAESDVLLYLVNAAESPAAAGYVAPEMELLGWVNKPVLVLLNQLGAPREPAAEAADVQAWREHLARWPQVRAVLPLDAFARCWVHEGALLRVVQQVLPPDKTPTMAALATAWQARSRGVFESAMRELAESLARTACAREPLDDAGVGAAERVLGSVRQMGSSLGELARRAARSAATAAGRAPAPAADDAERMTPAQRALATALDNEVAASTGRLLALHGLSGQAQGEILHRVAGQFAAVQRLPEGQAALWGGAVTGALAGLKADIASGGFTLGGGLLAGALLGALGAAGLARGINVVRGTDHSWLRWSDEALQPLVHAALLRYLAVAHFGRGRGDWVQGEAPPHWAATVAAALQPEHEALQALWAARDRRSQGPQEAAAERQALAAHLQPLLQRAALRTLEQLYPGALQAGAYHPPA